MFQSFRSGIIISAQSEKCITCLCEWAKMIRDPFFFLRQISCSLYSKIIFALNLCTYFEVQKIHTSTCYFWIFFFWIKIKMLNFYSEKNFSKIMCTSMFFLHLQSQNDYYFKMEGVLVIIFFCFLFVENLNYKFTSPNYKIYARKLKTQNHFNQ